MANIDVSDGCHVDLSRVGPDLSSLSCFKDREEPFNAHRATHSWDLLLAEHSDKIVVSSSSGYGSKVALLV